MNETINNPIETAKKLGLLESEYHKIKEFLQREPNFTELSIYSVMWSEHCSYKNSIKWLKTLPKDGERMLAKAGEENAGLVDLGDGLACAFKIESHNHPSAVEPYQGAATGVGGINRDIFTMGARPVAQLNSLRFGNLKNKRNKWLIKGVVKGIGDYGNAFGIPTVAGEVFFDDCFNQNPLVNAMSVGLVKHGETISAISYGEGNPVFIVGSSTGKDGIHGATFASADISENSVQDLPAVQVGDPFQEKLLLEATLELIKTNTIVGMQDMGAAGIICSTSEMSAKGKHGMDIFLDKVPTRQANMQPFEILLSESQERMLVVLKKGHEQQAIDIFKKWDLNCVQIGIVTKSELLNFYFHNQLVAKVPADSLVLGGGAPVYERDYKEPAYFAKNKSFSIDDVSCPEKFKTIVEFIISHRNIASKKWVYEQYDSMVGIANMSTNKKSDAAIVEIKNTNKALVLSVDCNSRYVYADPFTGCAIAVAEAARNIVCSGGKPLAVTNCLNFGNPYNPEVYWQFVQSIKGMSQACNTFKTPVTGGNVSFYNQYTEQNETSPVFPTPTIGMLGYMENKNLQTTLSIKSANSHVYLIGKLHNEINSSEYLYSYLNIASSPAPTLDLKDELSLQNGISYLISKSYIEACHDISDGGLISALLEMLFENKFGAEIRNDTNIRNDAFLFSESQSRALVVFNNEYENMALDYLKQQSIPFLMIAKTSSAKDLIFNNETLGSIEYFCSLYDDSLENELKS